MAAQRDGLLSAAKMDTVNLSVSHPSGDHDTNSDSFPVEPLAAATSGDGYDADSLNGEWVRDDGLLRDEGVYFGAVWPRGTAKEPDIALKHKLNAIEAFYGKQIAELNQRVLLGQEEVDRLENEMASLEEAGGRLREKLQDLAIADIDGIDPRSRHQLGRYGLGVVLGMAGCALACVFVYDILEGSSLDYPLYVAIAVSLLAFFSVFQPISILFVNDEDVASKGYKPEIWKLHLSEWIIPIAGATFVAVWGHSDGSVIKSITTGLLLFAAFAVSGRITLASISQLAINARLRHGERTRAKRDDEERQRIEEDLARNAAQLLMRNEELNRIRAEMRAARQRIVYLEEECKEKVNLFLSEFELVLHRRRLSDESE